MPTRLVTLACAISLLLTSLPAVAIDLLGSYDAALSEDAEYRAARAAAESGREFLPLARAQLLPSVSASMTQFRNELTSETQSFTGVPTKSETNYDSKNYSLTLRQPLYRPFLLAGYRQAQARVESVEAALGKARQDLGLRVIGAYLNVLLAEETERQLESQTRAIEMQLVAARRSLQAGLGTRTDVDDAQARLDMNGSKRLGARQQIDQARHELQLLINKPPGALRAIDVQRLELAAPQPPLLDEWIARAAAASPELRELLARRDMAHHEIDRAASGHKPTLDLIAQRTQSANDNVTNPNTRYDNSQIGVQLTIPLFAGGYVSAQIRQALAARDELDERVEALRRKLAVQVRKEFQGVQEGIEKIRANEQAERSAAVALHSNEKGFQAGSRTRVDILKAEESLAAARLELVRERMLYLFAHARLLALCDGLDRDALVAFNSWLAD